MIINTTLDGRPVKVLFINRAFEPVDEADAELVRVNFMDDEGGSMFLVPSHDDETKAKAFDPDEPRDEHGRWTSGGSGSGSSDPPPPSLDNLPVPVELSEGTGTDFQSEIAAAVASIPARALKTMADGGIKIRAGKKLTDLRPDLKGVHPRGWPAGTTWDSADGMFDRASKTVFVTELYRPIGSKEFKPGSRPRGVVLHESGHAFDLALDAPSRTSKAFASAYADDVKALPKGSKSRLGYYLQKKREAGRTETFAEIFGQYAGAGSSRNDIRPSFPRTSVLVKEAMIRGLWLEPIA